MSERRLGTLGVEASGDIVASQERHGVVFQGQSHLECGTTECWSGKVCH